MARVEVDPGFTPPGGSRDVSTNWFLRNGVWVISNGTVPIQQRSENQLNERAGFATGSRQFAYELSGAEQAAWDAAAPEGITGQQFMIGQQSCLWETGNVVDPFPSPGTKPECGAQAFPVYDSETGDLEWDLVFPDAVSGSTFWVEASMVLSAGRIVAQTRTRLIHRGDAVDGVIDLTSGLSTAFGSAAVGASGVNLSMRYGNAADGL